MKALLDTCVISELVSKKPNPKVIEYVDSLDPEDVYLSVITIGEIVKGIERLPGSRRKTDLYNWLKDDLLVRFEGNVVALDTEVLIEWGALTARLESVGKAMPAIDSLIAATALAKGMILATRNVSDFEDAKVEIVNPWK
ncbi:MAG: type II toxin-antitoxin system VapC family toxin [Anaerolineales bacterium]